MDAGTWYLSLINKINKRWFEFCRKCHPPRVDVFIAAVGIDQPELSKWGEPATII